MSGNTDTNYVKNKKALIFFGFAGQTVSFKPYLKSFSVKRKAEVGVNKGWYKFFETIKTGGHETINLSFDVVANSDNEGKENHRKFSRLIRFILPSVEPKKAQKYPATKFYVKFANLIQNGLTNSSGKESMKYASISKQGLKVQSVKINYAPDITMGFFEMGGKLFAKSFNINMELLVLDNITRNIKHQDDAARKEALGSADKKETEKIILGGNFGYRYGSYETTMKTTGGGGKEKKSPCTQAMKDAGLCKK